MADDFKRPTSNAELLVLLKQHIPQCPGVVSIPLFSDEFTASLLKTLNELSGENKAHLETVEGLRCVVVLWGRLAFLTCALV